MNIVITGVNGFVGGHLARQLHSSGHAVCGTARESVPNDMVAPYLSSYVQCDYLNKESVAGVNFAESDAIIHLAGLSSVGKSFEQPRAYMVDNGVMVDNLFEAAAAAGFSGRTLIVSTGALYASSQPMPLREDSITVNNSPYAVGKLFVENIAGYYAGRRHDVVIARPFNHIGPHQGQGFLLPDLYAQIKNVQVGSADSILVGNLKTERDYTDVRDIVKAYESLITASALDFPLYNICSGVSLSGQDILDTLLHVMGVKNISVIVDETKIRPNDTPVITGDSTRIRNELGWEPSIDITKTIEDFVNAQK